jgi:hypothetical protein
MIFFAKHRKIKEDISNKRFPVRSVKCVTRTTKVDNSVLPEPEIFSFITRFLLENLVLFHLKRNSWLAVIRDGKLK